MASDHGLPGAQLDQTLADLHISPEQLTDNDMLVDEYEQYNNDRTDVVVVSRSGSEEPEPEPLADDCMNSPCLTCNR